MGVTIHAVQTGMVQIKTAQRVRKPGGLVRILTDAQWTEWLPILAWVIEHPEGVIVVDTGETAKTATPGYFPTWHPYYRGSVRMRVQPEDEIGPQLRKLGISPRDVKTLVLTHFHTDHAGGLHHFPNSNILVSGGDYQLARGLVGRLLGYLPNHWPTWFAPQPVGFTATGQPPFEQSYRVTQAGDVLIIPTPGHTPGHISVLVRSEDINYLLAGDTSYNQALLLAQQADGVSPDASVTRRTLQRLLAFAAQQPLVYLPTHDAESVARLAARQTIALDAVGS